MTVAKCICCENSRLYIFYPIFSIWVYSVSFHLGSTAYLIRNSISSSSKGCTNERGLERELVVSCMNYPISKIIFRVGGARSRTNRYFSLCACVSQKFFGTQRARTIEGGWIVWCRSSLIKSFWDYFSPHPVLCWLLLSFFTLISFVVYANRFLVSPCSTMQTFTLVWI